MAEFCAAQWPDFTPPLTLLADADPKYAGRAHFYDIPSAARRALCRAEQIIRLLLDRRLARVGRNPEVEGYLSVLVDIDEIRPLASGEDHGGINLRTARARMGTSDLVLRALIKNGFIAAERVPNAVTKQIQTIIRPEELERFQSEFIRLHVLAKEREQHYRRVTIELRAKGIQPAFDPMQARDIFYRKADL